jgi:hypothetical protein
MKKLLLIAVVVAGFALVGVSRAEAGVSVGIGIGFPGCYPYGYYPYAYPAYYPYPYYGYYRPYYRAAYFRGGSRPYYWSHGRRIYYARRHR